MSHTQLLHIPYREADFIEIRRGGFAFVDKTQYIETLEHCSTRHPLIVRPPRSGKTLFTSILLTYYDKAASDNFDTTFSDTYIGEHRTSLASQFHVLRFNFSSIYSGRFVIGFKRLLKDGIADFCARYKFDKGYELLEKTDNDPLQLLSDFFISFLRYFKGKLYLIIDDFDGLTAAENTPTDEQTASLTEQKSLLSTFFYFLKEKAEDGVIERSFITGTFIGLPEQISTLFSFAVNLSFHPAFSTMFGFTEAELRQFIPQIVNLKKHSTTVDDVFARLKKRCDSYRFCPAVASAVYNAADCLAYLTHLQTWGRMSDHLKDPSMLTNFSDFHRILEMSGSAKATAFLSLISQHEQIPFGQFPVVLDRCSAGQLTSAGMLSALFYHGYLTYTPGKDKNLIVPPCITEQLTAIF